MILLEQSFVHNGFSNKYLKLIRFDKPVGTILLLWPTLWGLWVANQGFPNLKILFSFLCGVFIMRSAGCIINDLADRNFDGHVARTKTRPLVTQDPLERLTIKQALYFLVLLCGLAFLIVLSFNNVKLLNHSIIALFLASFYPFCKRFFECPQFVLGLAFGYAIPMGFVASQVELSSITWSLYFLSIMHSIIYDTYYAMSDASDDSSLQLKSSALWFYKLAQGKDLVIIGLIQLVFMADLVYIMYQLHFNDYLMLMTCSLVAIMFIYQQVLAQTRINQNYLVAFKNNNWVGLVIFLSFLIRYFH